MAQLEEESDAKIWVTNVQGGDLSSRKRIFTDSQFWLSYYVLKIGLNYVSPFLLFT